MRVTSLGLAAVLLLLAPLAAEVARAEEETVPPGLTEDEARVLRGKLRSHSANWWRRRKNLAIKCPQCKGVGQVRWRRGRRYVRVDCPKCDGHKIRVDSDLYRACFYDLRSPAFRLQEGIKARVTKEYAQAKAGKPFPEIVKRYSIKKVELVSTVHGIVHVQMNKDSAARPQRWILAKDGSKPPAWWLYDEAADGPWLRGGSPELSVDPEPLPEHLAGPREDPPPRVQPPPPVVEEPLPPRPQPEPPRPAPKAADRVDLAQSRTLIDTWTEERNELDAGVIRIELGLETVEGHKDRVESANRFLGEIKGWMKEGKPAYERALKDVEEHALGVLLADRLKINTVHFKAARRIELVEKMLIGILPELRKQ